MVVFFRLSLVVGDLGHGRPKSCCRRPCSRLLALVGVFLGNIPLARSYGVKVSG